MNLASRWTTHASDAGVVWMVDTVNLIINFIVAMLFTHVIIVNIPALSSLLLAWLWFSLLRRLVETFPFDFIEDFESVFARFKRPTFPLCYWVCSFKHYLLDPRYIIVHFLCLALNMFKIFNNSHIFLILILIFLFSHFQWLSVLELLLLLHVLMISKFLLLLLVSSFLNFIFTLDRWF